MASGLHYRAARIVCENPKPPRAARSSSSAAAAQILLPHQRVAAWRRITVKVRWFMTMVHLEMAVGLFSPEAKQDAKHNKGSDPREPRQPTRVINGEILGKPLNPTKSDRIDGIDPTICNHPENRMKRRGRAGMSWWTCLSCGSRWERGA
ncbi:MAG: hypothetical protein ACKPKO_65380, partial [Candidatus Fonsibacter sp.]